MLVKLQRMEDEHPGQLAKALTAEAGLIEAQVDAAVKGLYRIKKVLQVSRMHQMAEEL